jgi:hypothetical protein
MAEGKRKRRYDCDHRCVYFSSLPRKPRIACICERKTTRQVRAIEAIDVVKDGPLTFAGWAGPAEGGPSSIST